MPLACVVLKKPLLLCSLVAAVLSVSRAVVQSDISSICASRFFSSSWKAEVNQGCFVQCWIFVGTVKKGFNTGVMRDMKRIIDCFYEKNVFKTWVESSEVYTVNNRVLTIAKVSFNDARHWR